MKDLSRIKNRVKSLLFQFGIDVPIQFTQAQTRHWSNRYIMWLSGLNIEHQSLKQVIENYLRIGEFLRKELLNAVRQIRQLSRSEPYSNNYQLLITVPGIGLICAMTILVQFGDITRFKTLDELCYYIGLVPKMYNSGERIQVGELIHRGRKEIKIMLIEASWIASRHDPALMAKFNALSKTMHKNKAIIRIARKLLSRIRYVLTHHKEYEAGVVK
jgi:transposase